MAIGSVCYVFFTYSFLMVARHPFFALPMVYLPLLLLGVEQVLTKRRPYLLIVTVFLAAVSNFYFFYMLAIITAIYTVYRLCCLYDRHSVKQAMSGLLQVTLWAVVGVLMSAAILLPVVLAFMNDTRTAGYQFNWFYDAKFYKNFLSTYFTSSSELGSQTYLGFNAIAFPAICLLFFKRKPEEKPMRILFILSTLLLLFPAFGWLLNGLSYATNRWIWAYSLLVAYIVSFYRYSGSNLVYNTDLLAKTHSTSFYWSLQNPNIAQFINETELPAREDYMYKDLNGSAALQALAGVKYYVQKNGNADEVPYGFTAFKNKVFQSSNTLPLGYTYDSAITRANYEKLSSLEKQQALLQGVVLDSVPTGTAQATLSFTDKSLPYTITADKNVAVDGKKIHVYDKGAKVTLHFNGTPNSETYLRMGLRNYTDYPAYTYYKTQENDPLHRYNKEKWEKKDDTQKALVKQSARKFKQETLLGFRFGYSTENISVKQSRTLNFASAYELRFDGYKTYTVNAGYSKDAKTDITITFDARGIYDFSTLEVLEQPMTDTDRQVAKLAENTLENIQIGTDTVDGTVTLDRSKILLLTIPYCDGWTATVDGKEAQLLQANTMFSALALEPGEHTIHLTYRTPHLKAGLAVSVLGFAAFGATLLCTEVKKRKERKA